MQDCWAQYNYIYILQCRTAGHNTIIYTFYNTGLLGTIQLYIYILQCRTAGHNTIIYTFYNAGLLGTIQLAAQSILLQFDGVWFQVIIFNAINNFQYCMYYL